MPIKLIDLTSKRFGILVVIGFARIKETASKSRQYRWKCRCDCGNDVEVDGCCLRRGSARSCGCQPTYQKHGMTKHPVYQVWCALKSRCLNPGNACYSHYGERGISVCGKWKESFEAFYADVGDRPSPMHTIERINNDGNYEPGNCRWATRAEQNENTRQTRLLSHNGETLSVGKWARKTGIQRKTITSRIDRLGWSVGRALTTPVTPMEKSHAP